MHSEGVPVAEPATEATRRPIAVATTVAEVRREIAAVSAGLAPDAVIPESLPRDLRSRVALVPTMGALHSGHLALVDRARDLGDIVVVSIFVNPLQFNDPADLERYPRDIEGDLAMLDGHGVDIVFAPAADELYPDGDPAIRVTAGRNASAFEGATRPGHFDGMLTVVAKLFGSVGPDVALFGQKDAQQAFLVSRMVLDLDMPVAIEVVPTVRDDDGLALSSRNRFLSERERRAALTLPRMLEAAESASDRGIDAVLAAAQSVAMGEPLVQLDYFAVVRPETFQPVDDDYTGRAIVVVAARVGATRLIDNAPVYLGR
jgi:pantoate--beta-alanine ligase